MNNKISEKAVWENGITADEPDYTVVSQSVQTSVQSQPQMMFCYNCNQVIPANSAFCPWCQIELYATCPKCGAKYSSQYPACNQCGTNRKVFLEVQQRREDVIRKIETERARIEKLKEDKRIAEINNLRLEDLSIMKTYEFIKSEDYIIDFLAQNGDRNKDINLGFIEYKKSHVADDKILPIVEALSDILAAQTLPISIARDTLKCLILAYRKAFKRNYFNYWQVLFEEFKR